MKVLRPVLVATLVCISQPALPLCERVHELRARVDIRACYGVTFEIPPQLPGRNDFTAAVRGTVLSVEILSVEERPHPEYSIEPTWLKKKWAVAAEVPVFVDAPPEKTCPDAWVRRDSRVIVHAPLCCDTGPRGACAVGRPFTHVKLLPVSPLVQ